MAGFSWLYFPVTPSSALQRAYVDLHRLARQQLLHIVEHGLAIGIQTSAITFGRWDVACIIGCYGACLLLTAGLLAPLALGWPFWLGWLLAAAQLPWHYTLIRSRARAGCFTAFSQSHWLGACLFAGVALGFALR